MKKLFVIFALLLSFTTVYAKNDYVDKLTSNITSNNYNRTQARYLQKELNVAMGCELDTDGIIGSLTKSCIRSFQQTYGKSVTGWIDTSTRTTLNSIYLKDRIIVSANTANVRSSAGFGNNIVGQVSKGKIFITTGTVTVNGYKWYKVYYNAKICYVSYTVVKTTFVEIDIVSQTLRLYKNTELYLDTPVTTGKKDGTHDTNKGYFTAIFKDTNRYLQPSNSFVNYWIRFYDKRALGIHDASWRGSTVNFNYFGGVVYKSNMSSPAGSKYTGSHGCVNTPYPKMAIIYPNVNLNTPVYVH